MKNVRSPRPLGILSLLVLCLGASSCGSAQQPAASTGEPVTAQQPSPAAEPPASSLPQACSGGRAQDSVQWDPDAHPPAECAILARGLCFAAGQEAAACACAGCPEERCHNLETNPPQAACDG